MTLANSLDRTQIRDRVMMIFVDLFNCDLGSLSPDSSPDNVEGWDSLQHLSLVTSIEGEFAISLSEDQVVEMLSLGLIVEIVADSISERR